MVQELKTINPRLLAANLRFSFKLFARLRQQESSQNILISPYNVAIALAMIYNGAAGKTKLAMADTFELQGLSLSLINQSNALLTAILEEADPQIEIVFANTLGTQQDISLNPEFVGCIQTYYQAEVKALDFANPKTVDVINNWIYQQTQGKIPTIINEIKPEQIMVLISAAYFKGKWSQPFDPAQSVKRPFYLADGMQIQHPMMSQHGTYRYYENEQFQAVSLPYSQGRFTLDIFLTKSNTSLSDFYQIMTVERWQTWLKQFKEREGFIQLPRFRIEYATSLQQVLAEMGMGHALSKSANFEAMSSNYLALDQVWHQTFVEVNEVGTEAAAVTSMSIMAGSMMFQVPKPFRMVVNRPFFFVIKDRRSSTILFMGSIMNPGHGSISRKQG